MQLLGIDVGAAIRYPLLKGNRFTVLLVPSLLWLGSAILSLFLLFGLKRWSPGISPLEQFTVPAPFILLLFTLLSGFFWEMAARLQREGCAARMPTWRSSLGHYLTGGVKLLPYLTLTLIPALLTLFAILFGFFPSDPDQDLSTAKALLIILITPVLVAPVITAAEPQTFRAVFNLLAVAHRIRQSGIRFLSAIMLTFPLTLAYGLVIWAVATLFLNLAQTFEQQQAQGFHLLISLSGVFLFSLSAMAFCTTLWHIINQGLTPAHRTQTQQPLPVTD
jgi:hypothetical protein